MSSGEDLVRHLIRRGKRGRAIHRVVPLSAVGLAKGPMGLDLAPGPGPWAHGLAVIRLGPTGIFGHRQFLLAYPRAPSTFNQSHFIRQPQTVPTTGQERMGIL